MRTFLVLVFAKSHVSKMHYMLMGGAQLDLAKGVSSPEWTHLWPDSVGHHLLSYSAFYSICVCFYKVCSFQHPTSLIVAPQQLIFRGTLPLRMEAPYSHQY